MAPIRIGMIGLSAEATGTGWAAMAHLPYLLKSPQYKIVALCNRTVENAQAAIKAFDLGSSTKAYGSPDDLAKDPDVDLVVVNTRVDLHAKVLLPSIKAGKDVFCEWPLDGNFENVKEMVETAKQSGGRTIVGLQGRASPIAKKIKQIIEEGRIGKVLSSTLYGATVNGGAEESKMAAYLTDRKVGGNMLTIHFGHIVDPLLHVLGEPDTVQSLLATQIPDVKIIDGWATGKQVGTAKRDTPDQVMLQARLQTGPVVSLHLRGGRPAPFEPKFLWRIFGSKGEIEVSGEAPMLNTRTQGIKLRLHDQESDKVDEVEVDKDGFEELPQYAQNIGRVYEAFATGDKDKVLVDFEAALKRHELIEGMLKHWDSGEQGWKI